jgi:hypothetical protein
MTESPRQPPVTVMRARSAALFSQACKLEVLAAIAGLDIDTFTLADIGGGPAYASRYHKALQDLCDAELLVKLPRKGKLVPYRRVPSPLWAWVSQYVAALPRRP